MISREKKPHLCIGLSVDNIIIIFYIYNIIRFGGWGVKKNEEKKSIADSVIAQVFILQSPLTPFF